MPTKLRRDLLRDIGVRTNVSGTVLTAQIPTLSPREAQVIRWYYIDGLTEKQIGAQLTNLATRQPGVHSERVNQIRTKALRKLRHKSRLGWYCDLTAPENRCSIHGLYYGPTCLNCYPLGNFPSV